MTRFWIFMLVLAMAGCVAAPLKNSSGAEAMAPTAYATLLKKNTVQTNQYSGFYQTFQAGVTILTSEVQSESLKQRAQFAQWDQSVYQGERDKMTQEAGAYSKFFLRFFSPEHEYDDLHKAKSIWKVYLDYGGTRFEGKVRKIDEKFVELQMVYPHLDRFSTPYEVTFNVPMTTVEGAVAKITLTSSLGSAEFKFPTDK